MAATEEDKPAEDTPAKPAPTEDTSQPNSQEQQGQQQSRRMSWTDKAKAGLSNLGSKFVRKNSDSKESKPGRLSMEGLLKQARISFEKWVDTHGPRDYPMPNGIVFLTSVKGSLGWGAEMGTGVVFYRLPPKSKKDKQQNNSNSNNNDNDNKVTDSDEKNEDLIENNNTEWSGPCAIGSGGVSFGLQIGVSKIDHIIMLPAIHHVRTFTSKGQFKLGGSSELTVVNVGMKAQGSVNISVKEISDIHSYSLDTKGLALGVSVEGAVISMRNDCNATFYNQQVTPTQISHGTVKVPQDKVNNEDYQKILEILRRHFKIRVFRPHGPHHPAPGPLGPIFHPPGPHRPHRPHRPHHGPHRPFGHPPHRPGPHRPPAVGGVVYDDDNANNGNNSAVQNKNVAKKDASASAASAPAEESSQSQVEGQGSNEKTQ